MMQALPIETKSTPSLNEQVHLVVFVDADNTLWDTNAIYAAAQLGLLSDVEKLSERQANPSDRLGYVRQVDQEIARTHHLGLRYPPTLLVRAIALAISGLDIALAAVGTWRIEPTKCGLSVDEIEHIASDYQTALDETPPLNAGVAVVLSELHGHGTKIVVVTEGKRARVVRNLVAHGIATSVDKVIEATKTTKLFERLLSAFGKSVTAVMIGDQLTRDVIPASEAGLHTIHIRGGFEPRWEATQASVRPDASLDSFSDVPHALRSIINNANRKGMISCGQGDPSV